MLLDAPFSKNLHNRFVGVIVLLAIVKCISSISVYHAFGLLQGEFPLSVFLFVSLGLSSLVFSGVRQPWKLGLQRIHWILAAGYGFVSLLGFLFWCLALKYYGPFRTMLMSEYSDLVWIAFFNLFSKKSRKNTRGSIVVLIGYILFHFFGAEFQDVSENVEASTLSATTTSTGSGLLFLGLAIGFRVLRSSVAKYFQPKFKLLGSTKDTGGKLLFSMASICASVMVFPFAIVEFLTGTLLMRDGSGVVSQLGFVVLISFFLLVVDYYVDSYSRQSIIKSSHINTTVTATYIGSVLAKSLSTLTAISATIPLTNFGAFIGFLLLLFGFSMLTSHEEESDLPLSSGLEYSLPLQQTSPSQMLSWLRWDNVSWVIRVIWSNSDSRKIFIFMLVNFSFMFVELLYGWWTNSLGLISDSFHMMFDSMALAIGLYASVLKDFQPTSVYSYGYGRVQVVSGYVNGVFLCVIGASLLVESLKRIYAPPIILSDRLFLVSFLGFLVNLVGLFAFHNHSGHGGGEGDKGHGHSHAHFHSHGGHGDDGDENLYGVWLHVMADTLGSVGVMISSLLVWAFGWNRADPICSLIISIVILVSVVPLLKSTANTLLQKTPNQIENSYHHFTSSIKALPGVKDLGECHFWMLTHGQTVGTVQVLVDEETNEQRIIREINAILKRFDISHISVQVNKLQS